MVWPAPEAKAGHVVPSSVYAPQLKAVSDSKVRPFVRYDLRHGSFELIQLGVLRFRGDENGNVGVGVFPQREEILIDTL
jgi:hypothetical protein